MDPRRFDRLARTLVTAGSRRAALGTLLAGTVLGLAGGQRVAAQGCLPNHVDCHMDEECCSGRCKRKRSGKKLCKPAENQGICTVEQNTCAGNSIVCGTKSGGGGCVCYVTISGRSFCGNDFPIPPGNCDCTSNKECEQRVGKGAKCVAMGANPTLGCEFCGSGGTGCMAPCPNLFA